MKVDVKKFRELMKAKGVNQKTLATQINLTQKHVSVVLTYGKADLATLEKMAAGLGVKSEELIEE